MDATEIKDDAIELLNERLRPQVQAARKQLETANRRVTTFIKENPGKCLLGALALGYLVARLARRA